MSRTPGLSSFFGIGSMPHSGMPGPPLGPEFLQHQHMVRRDLEIVAVDLARHVVVVLEHQRRTAVLEQPRIGGGRLHHAAARREIAGEHRGGARGRYRVAERMDDVAQMHFARH